MKLQSVSSQAVDREPPVANRSDTQSVRFMRTPAVFDASVVSPAAFQRSVRAVERDNWPLRGGGLPGGWPVPTPEIREKTRALLLDGWSAAAAAARAGIGAAMAFDIRRGIHIPAVPPLMSREFRTNVVAWLNLGIPEAQIAHDMGVQPETVQAIAEAQREVSQNVVAPLAPHDDELAKAILKRVGRALLLPATRTKIQALLADGWQLTALANELGVRRSTVAQIYQATDLPVVLPLRLEAFKDRVIGRLHTGMSDAQVARETGVQPETVRLIRRNYEEANPENPLPDVRLHQVAELPGVALTRVWTASRFPQPGTSTVGETDPVRGRPFPSSPVAKRRRVDDAPTAISGPQLTAVIEQGNVGLSPHQIADNLRLSEDAVWQAEFLYLQNSLRAADEPVRSERVDLPPSPTTPPPASPNVLQTVIRQLQAGVERPDIARQLHLSEPQIRTVHDQLLDDEFAELDMDAFKAMTGSPREDSPG